MSDDVFFFFKQKTAYEMRISDWSSDVCSSDLSLIAAPRVLPARAGLRHECGLLGIAKCDLHRLTGLTKICFGRLTGCAAAYAGAKLCQRHAGPRPPLASAVTRRCLGLDAPAAQRLGKRLAKSKQILAAWVEPLAVQSLGLAGQLHVSSRRVRMARHEIIVLIAAQSLGGLATGLLHLLV